ncbi:NB-ARC domain protein [Stackebrandtia nassauensis DSM 44728]|uniref:NB-ARC domain protein n=1 Tax=Stackebrandtia nassauensis (strain DSM 44728 / CIP 108903 / NRRL B-16338 / NBRC 102104 / LLR-40K-21) TaxID=446470 RepID=D3PUN7_STANL|nr:NB-ARC domain protein [Stackebrandtia nassauensis DSM 44728]
MFIHGLGTALFTLHTEPVVKTQNVLNLDDLAGLLRQLRASAGNPSFREIQRRVRVARKQNHPLLDAVPSLSTVYAYFRNGRTRVDPEVVVAIAAALGATDEDIQTIRQLCQAVLDRFNRTRIVSTKGDIPAPTDTFVGRGVERRRIAQLANESRDQATVIVIEGMAGIGKSELALRAAQDLAEAARGARVRLYVNLRGYDPHEPPADPDAVVRGFLSHLGMPNFKIEALNAATRAARYRELLNARDAVVVLDNAFDAEQVRHLLAPSAGTVFLVTTRRRLTDLDSAHRMQLDLLPVNDALTLLNRYDPADRVDSAPQSAAQLVELCRRLPLELVAVGRQLSGKPEWELSDHVERLKRIPPSEVSRPALAVSYASLRPDEQRVFRQLSIHPGREFTMDTVVALTDLGREATESALRRLSDEHLLSQKEPGRYDFHDSIREYARWLADSDEPVSRQRAAIERLLVYYLDRLAGFSDVDVTWFVAERANMLSCLHIGTHDEYRVKLASVMHRQLRLLGHYATARLCSNQLLRLAYRGGDRSVKADALAGLAEIDRLTGDHDAAAELLDEVLTIRTELGDRKGQADTIRGLAQTIVGRDFDTASQRYRRALDIHREIGNRVGEAENLWGLLEIDLNVGDFSSAESCARQVIGICEDLGSQLGWAYGLSGLAAALTGQRDLDGAIDNFQRAWRICERIGNRRGMAYILRGWALATVAAGDTGTASEQLHRALSICTDIGDRLGQAESYCGLGDICLAESDLAQAVEHYEHALDIYREIHDRPWQAQALRGLGNAAAARGDVAVARDYWSQALEMAEPFRLPMVTELRDTLKSTDDGSPQ